MLLGDERQRSVMQTKSCRPVEHVHARSNSLLVEREGWTAAAEFEVLGFVHRLHDRDQLASRTIIGKAKKTLRLLVAQTVGQRPSEVSDLQIHVEDDLAVNALTDFLRQHAIFPIKTGATVIALSCVTKRSNSMRFSADASYCFSCKRLRGAICCKSNGRTLCCAWMLDGHLQTAPRITTRPREHRSQRQAYSCADVVRIDLDVKRGLAGQLH